MIKGQRASAKPLIFYSAWYCPFAQRAWMTLVHKDIDFDYIEVDPYRETTWWLNISRNRATVPVVVSPDDHGTGSTTVVDSSRVIEFLDDLAPEKNPVYPGSPNDKAELRFWVDHINERIVPNLYNFLKAGQPSEARDKLRNDLIDGVSEISGAMSTSGPFFYGEQITAVDLALLPFAYRIDALLGHYRDFSLPTTGQPWERYHAWHRAMTDTPIFQATIGNAGDYRERLIEHYLPYTRPKES